MISLKHFLITITVVIVSGISATSTFAFSEGGHHLIAVLAYRQLPRDQQLELMRILQAHPRFEQDFQTPKNVTDDRTKELWLIGRAGYWPDIARDQPEFNRPNWHYQLGSTLTIGNVQPPASPGPLPAGSSLKSKNLHIAQAFQLCSKILADKSQPDADRAVALCWVLHLAADAHQPCHAGSLYVERVFPDGDRGANSIETKQSKNMHALWDGLLGPRYNAGDILRRAHEIESDAVLVQKSKDAAKEHDGLNIETWLKESRLAAVKHVYAPEVLQVVKDATGGEVPKITLSEAYLKNAGAVARGRASEAGTRLAIVLGSL